MNERVTIAVEKREKVSSRDSRRLRRIGYVPGSISRKGKSSISVKVKQDELLRKLSEYGRNHIFNLQLDGNENIPAIVKELYYSPISRELITVDFQQISFTEAIRVNVEVKLIGKEALEFRKLLVLQQMDEIPVKGLPQNIPAFIEIDVTDLNLDDKITVGDVKYPDGIEPDIDADKIVLTIIKPKTIDLDAAEEPEEEEPQAKAG
ncbi:MAG: 50S ribosomal protein L25 [Clostridiaceae bacterium]|nr:50S ribosomal protein L25 [Clostridiaceae bacterium]